MINIAVMGYGTVGSGVVEVIDTNGERIAQRIGDALNVKYVLDIRDFPEDPIQEKIIHDFPRSGTSLSSVRDGCKSTRSWSSKADR